MTAVPVNVDEISGHPKAEVLYIPPVTAEMQTAVANRRPIAGRQRRHLPARSARDKGSVLPWPQPAHAERVLQESVNGMQHGPFTAAAQPQNVRPGENGNLIGISHFRQDAQDDGRTCRLLRHYRQLSAGNRGQRSLQFLCGKADSRPGRRIMPNRPRRGPSVKQGRSQSRRRQTKSANNGG